MNTKNKLLLGTLVSFVLPAINAYGATIDLTKSNGAVLGTSGSINGAIFTVADINNGAGTGNIESFLRIQKNTFEKGYNTDGSLEFDQKSGGFTHSLTMGQLETKTVDNVDYFRFLLDINQVSSKPLLSLHELELYVNSSTGSDSSYADGLGTKVWELDNGIDNTIELDWSVLSNGSGAYDIEALFPIANFGNYNSSDFFYLYSEFGEIAGQGSASNGEPSNDGFEEWAINTNTAQISQLPLPPAILLFGSSMIGLLLLKNRKA